jgi:aminoglycoside/choline kinase family phosphotransferase
MIPPAAAAAFLAANGWRDATIEPVAGDASFRRYFRAVKDGRSAILMDAPPPNEDPRPFIDIARWLGERGFAAPAIHGIDLDLGLVLLEDFGDVRMRETVDGDASREPALAP